MKVFPFGYALLGSFLTGLILPFTMLNLNRQGC